MRSLALALLALACAAAPAQGQLLGPDDAAELAQSLAEAREAQGVCYGWRITVNDANGPGGEDAGSSLGPGDATALTSAECPKFVLLDGVVNFTSELSEADDSASWQIQSSLERPPTVGELSDLGHTADGLLGDEDDEVLANAVGALPLLVADHGEADAVGFEPGDLPREQAGEPTGDPGSDLLRESWALLLICVLMLAGGLVWLVRTLRTPTTDPGGP